MRKVENCQFWVNLCCFGSMGFCCLIFQHIIKLDWSFINMQFVFKYSAAALLQGSIFKSISSSLHTSKSSCQNVWSRTAAGSRSSFTGSHLDGDWYILHNLCAGPIWVGISVTQQWIGVCGKVVTTVIAWSLLCFTVYSFTPSPPTSLGGYKYYWPKKRNIGIESHV